MLRYEYRDRWTQDIIPTVTLTAREWQYIMDSLPRPLDERMLEIDSYFLEDRDTFGKRAPLWRWRRMSRAKIAERWGVTVAVARRIIRDRRGGDLVRAARSAILLVDEDGDPVDIWEGSDS